MLAARREDPEDPHMEAACTIHVGPAGGLRPMKEGRWVSWGKLARHCLDTQKKT